MKAKYFISDVFLEPFAIFKSAALAGLVILAGAGIKACVSEFVGVTQLLACRSGGMVPES